MGQLIISFSLYGTAPRYVNGAVFNAMAVRHFYPGWKMRLYCEDNVSQEVVQKVESWGGEVRKMGHSVNDSGILWRFLPVWEKDVERVLFRDADSILNPREAAAVGEWIGSGLKVHIMHDHPHHCCLPMMGGMSGMVQGVLDNAFPNLIGPWTLAMGSIRKGVVSAQFLQTHIYPLIQQDQILRHSSVPVQWNYRPFPAHVNWEGFVGQQHDDQWNPVWPKEG